MTKDINILNDLIGKPYKEGGRGPDSYDCWGIVVESAKRAGVILPNINVPDDFGDRDNIISGREESGFSRIPHPVQWSIALFRIIGDSGVIRWHVGLVLPGCKKFVHTTKKTGVNISYLDSRMWSLFLEGFYIYRAEK